MFVLRFETAWCPSGVGGQMKNRLCKQSAVEKRLILFTCRPDEKTAKYCGVSVTTVTGKEMRELNRIPMHAPGKETPGRPERLSDYSGLFVIKNRALNFHAKK